MTEGSGPFESQQILSALARIFRRRKLLLAACMAIALIPVVYYNETTKPVYEAATSLVFEEVSNPIPGDPYRKPSIEQYLFNRLEEINSRSFADDIARAMPESLLSRIPPPKKINKRYDRMEYIGFVIEKALEAHPVRGSNIFTIKVQMHDRRLCVAIADLSLKVLQDREYRIHRRGVTDLRAFLDQQLESYGRQLDVAERDLRSFKERHQITSLDNESSETLRMMTDAEVLLNTTRASRGASEERLSSIHKTVAAEQKSLIPTLTNVASPSARRLKDRLVELQGQYAQLLAQNYPADHPQFVTLQAEIDKTRTALVEEAQKLVQSGMTADPITKIETLQAASVNLELDIEGFKAQENQLRRTVEGYRRDLSRLPSQELELARLVRERDVNQKIYTTLLERREEVRISEAERIADSRLIDRAQRPETPIKPRKRMNLALGGVLGLILGLGIGLVLEGSARDLDSTIEFERTTGWPVLALVPRMKASKFWPRLPWLAARNRRSPGEQHNALVSHVEPASAAGEAYLILRTRLELLGVGTRYRTLLVTSTWPGEGKSTTVSNLAAAFGGAGHSTLVVDAELRRPVMHQIFGLRRSPGLSDVLIARNGDSPKPDDAHYRDPVQDAFRTTHVPGVSVLTCGKRIDQARWEISQKDLRSLTDDIRQRFEVVLIDSASPLLVHDTLMLCSIVDAVLVVVEARGFDQRRFQETKRLIDSAGGNVVGVIVNKIDPAGKYGYYYSHYYSHQA
jgi:polysaccharide biosynthesis transport protein